MINLKIFLPPFSVLIMLSFLLSLLYVGLTEKYNNFPLIIWILLCLIAIIFLVFTLSVNITHKEYGKKLERDEDFRKKMVKLNINRHAIMFASDITIIIAGIITLLMLGGVMSSQTQLNCAIYVSAISWPATFYVFFTVARADLKLDSE